MDPDKSDKKIQRMVTKTLWQAASNENEDAANAIMDNTNCNERFD